MPDPQKPGTHILPRPDTDKKERVRKAPLYHVILHDDDKHTFGYVIIMLMQLFGKTAERAKQHADEVHTTGASIVETTTLERAELKRDQIRAYGDGPIRDGSVGSMSATIEPAE